MLQHFYCPAMQMILPLRDRINVLGYLAIHALRTYPWGTSGNERADFGLLPLPLMKWLRSSEPQRRAMINDYHSEAEFLGINWLKDSGFISTLDQLPTFDTVNLVRDPQFELNKISSAHYSVQALYQVGQLYGMINAIMDDGGALLVSETAAIAAQLEFLSMKMGPDAAIAVADILLAHPFYKQCGELIWRFVDRRAPRWEQFMQAFIVATWCLMSDEVRPILRFEIACGLRDGDPPSMGGKATLAWLDRFSDKTWQNSIFTRVKDAEMVLYESAEIHKKSKSIIPPNFNQHLKMYRGTVINLIQKYSSGLIDEPDWCFKPDFLRTFTQSALQENLVIYVSDSMNSYTSAEDWLDRDRGISFSGVGEDAVTTLTMGYYFSCIVDAIFLGDGVNPLPIGDYLIKDFLAQMALRPVSI